MGPVSDLCPVPGIRLVHLTAPGFEPFLEVALSGQHSLLSSYFFFFFNPECLAGGDSPSCPLLSVALEDSVLVASMFAQGSLFCPPRLPTAVLLLGRVPPPHLFVYPKVNLGILTLFNGSLLYTFHKLTGSKSLYQGAQGRCGSPQPEDCVCICMCCSCEGFWPRKEAPPHAHCCSSCLRPLHA